MSWVCVWGLCATLALGSDVWNLVSRVLCQSLVSSVWHLRLMVLPGSWGQFGIGAAIWGSAFGSGSAPGSRFWSPGLVSVLASGVCELMVIGSNSMAAGVPELGCGEEGNVIIASSSILVQNSCECSMATRRLSSVPGES